MDAGSGATVPLPGPGKPRGFGEEYLEGCSYRSAKSSACADSMRATAVSLVCIQKTARSSSSLSVLDVGAAGLGADMFG